MIKIDFEFDSPHGCFRDAIHLPEDHLFTDEEIQAMKQQRFDSWIAIITAPPPNYVLDADGNIVHDENGNPVIAE